MRILIQRVHRAEVRIPPSKPDGHPRIAGRIDAGYVVLVGFSPTDTLRELEWMAEKILGLRLFDDDDGKMNVNIADTKGSLLVVSQFTLYADAKKGKRPSYTEAARPETAQLLYNQFVELLRGSGLVVEQGEFGAHMDVELVNDGPVTIWLERASPLGPDPRQPPDRTNAQAPH